MLLKDLFSDIVELNETEGPEHTRLRKQRTYHESEASKHTNKAFEHEQFFAFHEGKGEHEDAEFHRNAIEPHRALAKLHADQGHAKRMSAINTSYSK